MRKDIRNVAIIAHVDHGKTSLVDALFKESGMIRNTNQSRIMDSNELERERGITILAKNTAIDYKKHKINIIDTPGHADFGGEVERVLQMASGAILVLDAFEGVMPQTKVVLRRAFDLDLPLIICINKIDRKDARPEEVAEEVLELFMDFNADASYIDSPIIFTSARDMSSGISPEELKPNMEALLDAIIEWIPAPEDKSNEPFQLLISAIDYNDYVGRIGIGKIESGEIKLHDNVRIINAIDDEKELNVRITSIYEFKALERKPIEYGKAGDIIAVSGVEGITVGDTLTKDEETKALPFSKISEPTLSMVFSVNDSPFAGTEGEYLTSQRLKTRLFNESMKDVSLKIEDTDSVDSIKVYGRGELHFSVLIETMRREGYEFKVSKPEVIFKKDENGKKTEPMEIAVFDMEEEYAGTVIEKIGKRKGEIQSMEPYGGGLMRIVFHIPTRGLIGYRQEYMTDTGGTGTIHTEFKGYETYKGDIIGRTTGSLVSTEDGEASSYGLFNAQNRGRLFIAPGTKVYQGMIVGESLNDLDIEVNVCRTKAHTNIRAAGADEAIRLSPPQDMSLERVLEFITDGEEIEITPENIRLRKIILNPVYRNRKRSRN